MHAPPSQPPNGLVEEGEDEISFEEGGYFEDGAFIAAPTDDVTEQSRPAAQDLYHISLLSRFKQLQAMLKVTPPLSAIELLTSSQCISFPPGSKSARKRWRDILRAEQPNPTQVACMDAESVLAMVVLLADCMAGILRGGTINTVGRFGAWAWAILGKTRDVSELGSEEVAELRRMGKIAVDLVSVMRREALWRGGEGCDNQLENGKEGSPADSPGDDNGDDLLETPPAGDVDENRALEEVKKKLTERLDLEVTHKDGNGEHVNEGDEGQTNLAAVIVDMIITIVGEVYGQRDLLEFREVWKIGTSCE